MTANDSESSEISLPKLTLPLLSFITTFQLQNGLRHGDYQRYRQYLTRRLRRIRKSIKFVYGKGRQFVFKRVDTENALDSKYLEIPLLNAERAWSYAMQLQEDQSNDVDNTRIKFHLAGRLAKAVKWSRELQDICSQRADGRTSLEAEAYHAYLSALYLLEKEDWQAAYDQFITARRIYEELGKVGSLQDQDLYQARIEKIDPSIRYCRYNSELLNQVSGSSRGKDNSAELRTMREGVDDKVLQAKLDTVLGKERKRQAASLDKIKWFSTDISVPTEKLRVAMLKVNDLSQQLKFVDGDEQKTAASKEVSKDSKYLELFSTLDDAQRLVSTESESIKNLMSSQRNEQQQQLKLLDNYIKYQKLTKLMDRNLQMLHHLEKQESEHFALTGNTKRAAKKASKRDREGQTLPHSGSPKTVTPDDFVHLLDVLLKSSSELRELAETEQFPGKEVSRISAQDLFLQACRSFYIAEAYAGAAKWPESVSVYERAFELAGAAGEEYRDYNMPDASSAVAELLDKISAHKSRAHGKGFLQSATAELELVEGVKDISVIKKKKTQHGTLLERQSVYYGGDKVKKYNLIDLPPAPREIACKPVLFDIAYNAVEMPDISHRAMTKEQLAQQERNAKGWFGWLRG